MPSTASPVKDMLALFVATFGGEVDTWQVRAYERALKDQPRDVLLAAADLLIDEAAGGRKFYPMPTAPDVKGACAKVIEVWRLRAFLQAASVCDHAPKYWEEIDGKFQRCSHWKLGRMAMEQVGQPLALPAAEEA